MRPTSRALVFTRAKIVACLLVGVSSTAGCPVGTVTSEEFTREWGVAVGTEDLFGGMDSPDLVETFGRELGARPIRARNLTIWPSHALLEAQDPKHGDVLVRAAYYEGAVRDVQAVAESGSFEAALFTLDDVTLARIPEMIAATCREARQEKCVPSEISVKKTNGALGVNVSIVSGRDSRTALFDSKGVFLRLASISGEPLP